MLHVDIYICTWRHLDGTARNFHLEECVAHNACPFVCWLRPPQVMQIEKVENLACSIQNKIVHATRGHIHLHHKTLRWHGMKELPGKLGLRNQYIYLCYFGTNQQTNIGVRMCVWNDKNEWTWASWSKTCNTTPISFYIQKLEKSETLCLNRITCSQMNYWGPVACWQPNDRAQGLISPVRCQWQTWEECWLWEQLAANQTCHGSVVPYIPTQDNC